MKKVNTDRSSDSVSKSSKPVISSKRPSDGENTKQWKEDQAETEAKTLEPVSGYKSKAKPPSLTITKYADEPESYYNI